MNEKQYRYINNKDDYGASIHPSVKIGKGLVIGMYVVIEEDVVIGDDCFIGPHCLIRPGSVIGDRVTMRSFCLLDPEVILGNDIAIYPHATVGGGTVVEDKVYWGPYSLTTNCDNIRFHRLPVEENVIRPPIVRRGAIIAAGCMIKPGVVIGRNSVLGMGSVLTKDIPDNEVWFGNPARYFRNVAMQDRLAIDITSSDDVPPWPYSIVDYNNENGIRNE